MIDKLSWFFIEKAHAQSSPRFFDLFRPWETSTQPGASAQATFSAVVANVMTWVLAVVAIMAFIYLIISGVNYITAGGDAEKATKARTGILNAIIGIVVVVLSFFILRFAMTLGTNVVNR